MRAQKDTSVQRPQASRPLIGSQRTTTLATPAALSRQTLTPDGVTVIQRMAGNRAAARAVQRTATAEEHASLQQAQHQPYERTVADYLAAGGPPKLYRSIRIQSQTKRRMGGGEITAPPDGNLGQGLGYFEVPKLYQALKRWPESADIQSVDPSGTYTVAHHVSGGNLGTQYISCTPLLGQALHYSRYDFNQPDPSNMDFPMAKPRHIMHWAPVIEIDVSKLGSGVRLVDLNDSTVAGQTNLGEAKAVAAMASQDREVLVKGTISAGAVTRVIGVEDGIREMALDVRRNLIEKEFRLGARPDYEGDQQDEWDRMYQKVVPEEYRDHFEHVREPQPKEKPAPKAALGKRPASPPSPDESKPEWKPRKKPKRIRLSFQPDEE